VGARAGARARRPSQPTRLRVVPQHAQVQHKRVPSRLQPPSCHGGPRCRGVLPPTSAVGLVSHCRSITACSRLLCAAVSLSLFTLTHNLKVHSHTHKNIVFLFCTRTQPAFLTHTHMHTCISSSLTHFVFLFCTRTQPAFLTHTHTHTHTHTCTLAFLALTHTLYHLYFFLSELNNRSFSCFLSHSHTLQVHKLYEDSILQSTVLRLTEDEDAVPGVRVSHVPLSHFLSHSLLFPSWCASRPFLYLPRLAFPLLRVVGLLTRCHENECLRSLFPFFHVVCVQ
jgi:hypothetical protein